MSSSDTTNQPSIVGHFVVGWGEGVAEWLRARSGYEMVTEPDDAVQAAVRGAVQLGASPDGTRWLALADLVEGQLEESLSTLTTTSPPQSRWRGRFAEVIWNSRERTVAAVTDHFSTIKLSTLTAKNIVLVGTDLRLLSSSPWCDRSVNLEAVYHFFNFNIIPAPNTIFSGIRRIEPSTRLVWKQGESNPKQDTYYIPEYAEDLRGTEAALAGQLRDRIVDTVHRYMPQGKDWGCFLSGGTDSSSIVSILSKRAQSVRTFSIGFAEEAFDELTYAKLAAGAVHADATFHRIPRAEAQALLERVVESYDQPFANASAVPTLGCADLARKNGVSTLVAGDGGDEIFGGNERYAKDRVMEAWYRLPGPVKSLGKTVGNAVGGGSNFVLNRVQNFVQRASLPNPDRFYTDDSFASDHFNELLSPDFVRAVDRNASLEHMRSLYSKGTRGSSVNRLLRLDLLMCIAQNDVPKVHGATNAVGITTRFPYLDPALVAFTGRLPAWCKVRGLEKRYLFKKAMKDILPREILAKKKQGFGLPVGEWMRSDQVFKDHVRDTLFGSDCRTSQWWKRDFVEGMMDEHERGGWDNADYIWRLLVLELWIRKFGRADQ